MKRKILIILCTCIIFSVLSSCSTIYENKIDKNSLSVPINHDIKTLLENGDTDSVQTSNLPTIGDMSRLITLFKEMNLFYDSNDVKTDSTAGDSAVMESASADTSSAGANYSTTNIQVNNVDESDIIKTDGEYIYYSYSGQIAILKTDGQNISQVSLINTDDYIRELYISGDHLITISTKYIDETDHIYENGGAYDCIWPVGKEYTCYVIYDISDRSAPIENRRIEIEGSSLQTRLIGNNFYFVCNKWIHSMDTSKDINIYDLLPSYSDTVISEQKITISPENIYYCPGDLQNTYLLVGAFDITSDTPCIPDTILGSGDTIYMNAENLYIARQNWLSDSGSSGKVTTDIYRFSANEASLNYTGSGSVDGYIINQYSMDEYNGFFRIATTSTDSDWNESNNVFILDSSLNIVGSITDMAPGETIQSVRFDGDTGYVITFEQIDPLFVLDLSTPENPSVLGELKIPGFSEYLHPFGDNLLLGIGRHTSELYSRDEYGNETIEGITDKGLKISIFDVNDPSTPTEISKIVLGSDWNTYSEVSYNPRSLMTDFEKGIIGVPVCSYDDYTNGEFYGYVLLQIDSDGIESLANLGSDTWCDNPRICYIGNYLYLILNDSVMVYNYSNYTLQNTVNINFAEPINEYVCY